MIVTKSLLVVNRIIPDYSRPIGTILSIHEENHSWTKAQKAEYFSHPNVELEDGYWDIIAICIGDFLWDFPSSSIRHFSGADLHPNMLVKANSFSHVPCEAVASSFDWEEEKSPCEYLFHVYFGENDIYPKNDSWGNRRKHWLRACLPHASLEGMDFIIWALRFSFFGSIIEAFRDAPLSTKEILRESDFLTSDDKFILSNNIGAI